MKILTSKIYFSVFYLPVIVLLIVFFSNRITISSVVPSGVADSDYELCSCRTAEINPYLAYTAGLKCLQSQSFVITDFLTVVAKVNTINNYSKIEQWALRTSSGHLILFENHIDDCQPFSFKTNDLVKISGALSVREKQIVLSNASVNKNHLQRVEYEGRNYCDKK